MSIPEDLIQAMDTRPFVPFLIHLADQRVFEVNDPHRVAVFEDHQAVAVAVAGKGFHVLSVAMVTGLEFPSINLPK
jgi:hypothetical protein